MSQVPPGWADEQMEQIVGNLLRTGVILAGIVVCLGAILYLGQNGLHEVPNYTTFEGVPADLKSPKGIIKESLTLRSEALIQLGLLLLIATPVARVLFTILAFLRTRDYLYVVITVMVFVLLVYSLFFEH